jgi:hypothetical protein
VALAIWEVRVGFDELGELLGQAPLAGHEAGGLGVRPAELRPLQVRQPRLAVLAAFEQFQVLARLLLGEQGNGHVLQQRPGEQVLGLLQAQQLAGGPREQGPAERILPQALQVERPAPRIGHQAEHGAPQREVLDRADADQRDRQLDARDLAGEAEVRRVDELQHLAGQPGVRLDRHGELGGAIVRILRQLEQANGTLRQSGELSATEQFFTAAGWEHTSHWRFPAKRVLSTSQWQVPGVAKFQQRMDFHPAILAFGMIAVAVLAFFVWDPTRDTSAELGR